MKPFPRLERWYEVDGTPHIPRKFVDDTIHSRIESLYFFKLRQTVVCQLPVVELVNHSYVEPGQFRQMHVIMENYLVEGSWFDRHIAELTGLCYFDDMVLLRAAWLTGDLSAITLVEEKYDILNRSHCLSRFEFYFRLRKIAKLMRKSFKY